ncbi:MAG: ribonuclease/clavin/mitogillin [Cognaticolwellia sp.]|jgi:ribonuclease/clavin/mitogillin
MTQSFHPVRCLPVRTPTLPPATHTNCYVLGPPDALVVVDPASPWEEEQEALWAQIQELGQVAVILLTHHHLDHVGGVQDLVARTGAPVLAHPLTAERVDFKVDRLVDEGEQVAGWTLLHTPGHATGHLCLWRPESGELIAGDMVAGQGTIVLEPPEGDLADYLASLERLAALAPESVYPAHGPELQAEVFDRYIAHRTARSVQIQAALSGHSQSALELVAQVYGDTIPKFVYPLAARQVRCHLEWLRARGRAQDTGSGWTV